ncbi:tripartite tricarboxylate transporter substrate binding protein [Siccirubricoccus sp. KC 17139]|uniref:Tripartite tricarboxylate transporter substrate binding protein n=1 Tax=Siccirubricoccus soli TaxID=2899147 RepID=A0ABT1D392_9PROT|nr:tripartite tricarboxylate transporter substrate binding protein [Siccirubricoccus soli]MCO6416390.1 tripartite tricarboxylate transporter substrate binding protein [Siccirubricoccus soli]MCP2682524.1 tripartite tricarboxylate transporter substrate binding protein [Siccirubricoccus soli]
MPLMRRTALGLLAALPTAAHAQPRPWPNRSLRCIVPSAAGGYEVYARILAPRLSELLGQPVVVDNKPGANGTIGMQELQRSPPDGYTFMFAHVGAISIGTSIYPNMPLDPVEDLASIAVAVTSPLVWSANPAAPFRTLPEMVARVQEEPGAWRYGLPASGSIPHLVAEDFKRRHRLDLPAVPYRSTPQSLMAVIAGEVPVTVDSLGASHGHLVSGRLRPLAITSRTRSDRLPEVPTAMETGLDTREWVAWYAFMAPKATPPEAIARLNAAINQAVQEAPIATRIRDLGASPRVSTPEEMLAFIRAEKAEYGAIARAGGIRVE